MNVISPFIKEEFETWVRRDWPSDITIDCTQLDTRGNDCIDQDSLPSKLICASCSEYQRRIDLFFSEVDSSYFEHTLV